MVSEPRIGVSGWSYDHWRGGAFYPEDLPQKRELEFASRRFNSIEINGSFYSLLRPESYERYRRTAPADFRFAVKGGQFITHSKKLRSVEKPVANFFASGLLRLEDKLGPILWQFPDMTWPLERVRAFVELLPSDTESASRLAARHDHRLNGRSSYVVHRNRRLRHAFEFRHRSFFEPQVVRWCRDANVALVFADSGDWPYTEELTAGFVYLRLHGSPRTYQSNYGGKALERWARRIRTWADGGEPGDSERITDRKPPARKRRTVYAYFDNDHAAHAPRNAARLMRLLEVEPPAGD